MTSYFYQTGQIQQIVLLILSQFTVIAIAAGYILLFRRRCKLQKQLSLGATFLLNAVLYVLMQLDSRINGAERGLHLQIPYVVLLLIILLSLAYTIWAFFSETKQRKTISSISIKEAFDNLPTGVCFFNAEGLPVLCNLAMYRFSFAVCGKDIQFITDLENCFADDFIPADGVVKEGKIFVVPDGSAWRLEKRSFSYESINTYIQYIAADVTDLHEHQLELMQENEQLYKVQADLKKLSANVVAITREEEILNTKMRVHDEMGRCLTAAQQYLKDESGESIPDSLALSWQRAVSMIKYSNDTPDEDMLSQIRKTCEFVKVRFIQTGELPKEENAAYHLTCAVRECVTNAVRYAQATELYAAFSESESGAAVVVTNNGKIPESEIVEGGGLSTLRRRVERCGGSMTVQSFPYFQLTVTVPKEKEGIS